MEVHVVVPVQDPERGKSRLASALSASQRARLIRTMLDHVVHEACGARGVSQVSVLTAKAEVVPDRCAHLDDHGRDLNSALAGAARELLKRGAQHMLVVHADLPFVARAEIEALAEHGAPSALVAAPDWLNLGTNALRVPLTCVRTTCFGPASLAAHAALARGARVPFELIVRPGLARDIDEPEQLADLAAAGGEAYGFLAAGR